MPTPPVDPPSLVRGVTGSAPHQGYPNGGGGGGGFGPRPGSASRPMRPPSR